MSQYRITPKARDDLRNIGRYTQQQWGRAQRNEYLKGLEKRFDWLAKQPRLGKHHPEVGDGYSSFIDIIGLPHKHMDVIQYFDVSDDKS